MIKLKLFSLMHRWPLLILAIMCMPFGFIALKTLNYLAFQSFDIDHILWRLFQKRVVRTKFDIYVFIKTPVIKQEQQKTGRKNKNKNKQTNKQKQNKTWFWPLQMEHINGLLTYLNLKIIHGHNYEVDIYIYICGEA